MVEWDWMVCGRLSRACKVCWRTRKMSWDKSMSNICFFNIFCPFSFIIVNEQSKHVAEGAWRCLTNFFRVTHSASCTIDCDCLPASPPDDSFRWTCSTSGWQSWLRLVWFCLEFSGFLRRWLCGGKIFVSWRNVAIFKSRMRENLFADIPQSNSALNHSIKRFVVGKLPAVQVKRIFHVPNTVQSVCVYSSLISPPQKHEKYLNVLVYSLSEWKRSPRSYRQLKYNYEEFVSVEGKFLCEIFVGLFSEVKTNGNGKLMSSVVVGLVWSTQLDARKLVTD